MSCQKCFSEVLAFSVVTVCSEKRKVLTDKGASVGLPFLASARILWCPYGPGCAYFLGRTSQETLVSEETRQENAQSAMGNVVRKKIPNEIFIRHPRCFFAVFLYVLYHQHHYSSVARLDVNDMEQRLPPSWHGKNAEHHGEHRAAARAKQ